MNYVENWYVRSWYVREVSDTVGNYTFDKYWKHIFVSEAVASINLPDMWSRFVDWYVVDENTKSLPAMKYSGFDIIPTWFTGATFFMYNWWKCVYNPNTTAISWVLYSEDFSTWYWDVNWNPIYPVTVSAVVNTVSVWSWLSAEENQKLFSLENTDLTDTDIAIAWVPKEVWDRQKNLHSTAWSYGEELPKAIEKSSLLIPANKDW